MSWILALATGGASSALGYLSGGDDDDESGPGSWTFVALAAMAGLVGATLIAGWLWMLSQVLPSLFGAAAQAFRLGREG